MRRRRILPVFFILGLVFFALGWVTDQDTYFYISIPFLAIAFFASGRRRR